MEIKSISLRFTEANFRKLAKLKEQISKEIGEQLTWETFVLYLAK